MDWGKAKNIFIITFFLLNLLLGYQLYLKTNENVHGVQWSSSNMEELQELLNQQNIKLSGMIPKEVPEMHFHQVTYKSFNNERINMSNYGKIYDQSMLESVLKEYVLDFDKYNYSTRDSNGKKLFVYYQHVDNYPIFGSRLDVTLKDDGEVVYDQNYFEFINQGLDRKIISSYSAIRTLLDQQLIPDGAEIKKISLGYNGQNVQTSTQALLTPAWKIDYQKDSVKGEVYINAMTGGLQNILSY